MIAFSTFLGAAVALVADRLTGRYNAKLREEAAINNLILDLASKRAFLFGGNWDWGEGEVARVVGSVHHARRLIREARGSLMPRSKGLRILREMTRACNTFLEHAERDDDQSLKSALAQLSRDISHQVAMLHALAPSRILDDEPGSFALRAPV